LYYNYWVKQEIVNLIKIILEQASFSNNLDHV